MHGASQCCTCACTSWQQELLWMASHLCNKWTAIGRNGCMPKINDGVSLILQLSKQFLSNEDIWANYLILQTFLSLLVLNREETQCLQKTCILAERHVSSNMSCQQSADGHVHFTHGPKLCNVSKKQKNQMCFVNLKRKTKATSCWRCQRQRSQLWIRQTQQLHLRLINRIFSSICNEDQPNTLHPSWTSTKQTCWAVHLFHF